MTHAMNDILDVQQQEKRQPVWKRNDHTSNLPTEILIAIFLQCVQDAGYSRRTSWFISRRAPLSLCGVCHRWRDIALSTPMLWSVITVIPGTPSTPSKRVVETWLQRSQTRPLSLVLKQHCPSNASYHYVDDIFMLYAKHIQRWKHISFEISGHLIERLGEISGHSAPMLETMEILVHRPYCKEEPGSRVISRIPDVPNLKVLKWHSFSSLLPATVPWPQLTMVELSCPASLAECVGYLSQCSMVQEVKLDGIKFSPLHFGTPLRTTLKYLSKLSVRIYGDAATFLDCFTLPALKYLQLTYEVYRPSLPRDYVALQSFFHRSSCPLEVFGVMDTHLSAEGVVALFKIPYLQGVKGVEIDADSLTRRMVSILRAEMNNSYPSFARLWSDIQPYSKRAGWVL